MTWNCVIRTSVTSPTACFVSNRALSPIGCCLQYGIRSIMHNALIAHWQLHIPELIKLPMTDILRQRCTTFLGQGPQHIIFKHSRAEDKIMTWTSRDKYKKRYFYLSSLFIVCDFTLFLPELFPIVSCKIVNSTITFRSIHKISVIEENFLVFFYLLWGLVITRSGAGSGPWAAGCASLLYAKAQKNA